jgi:ribonuclease PH
MLDLAYEEDARAEVDMNLIATGAGRFVEVQGTGEEATFSVDELNQLTALGLQGVADLGAIQQRAIAGARRTQ